MHEYSGSILLMHMCGSRSAAYAPDPVRDASAPRGPHPDPGRHATSTTAATHVHSRARELFRYTAKGSISWRRARQSKLEASWCARHSPWAGAFSNLSRLTASSPPLIDLSALATSSDKEYHQCLFRLSPAARCPAFILGLFGRERRGVVAH
jgi:hypothetical protein